MAKAILVTWPHPLRWLRYFCKALLYGPDYSPYDELRERYEAESVGYAPSSRKQPRLRQSSRLLADTDGFSDKDDESYYGL